MMMMTMMMMMTIIITTMMMMMTRSQDVSVSVPPWSRLAVGFDWLPSGSTACIVNQAVFLGDQK